MQLKCPPFYVDEEEDVKNESTLPFKFILNDPRDSDICITLWILFQVVSYKSFLSEKEVLT